MFTLVIWLFVLLPDLPVKRLGCSTLLLIRVVLAPRLLLLRIEATILLLWNLLLVFIRTELGLISVFARLSRLCPLLIRVLITSTVLRVILDILFLGPRLACFAGFGCALT